MLRRLKTLNTSIILHIIELIKQENYKNLMRLSQVGLYPVYSVNIQVSVVRANRLSPYCRN